MGQRTSLQLVLEACTPNVYFQPPSNVSMSYPCIVYSRDSANTIYADGVPYNVEPRYMVTVMDRNPDSSIISKVANLPKCSYDRHYVTNGINHDVFRLFF